MNKKLFIILIILFIIVLTTGIIELCVGYKQKLEIANHNIKALQDTVRIHKDANNKLFTEKMTLLASEKELKELSKDLYNNIKSLEWKNKILAGVNSTAKVTDSIKESIPVYLVLDKDTTYRIVFQDSCIKAEIIAQVEKDIMTFNEFYYSLSIPVEAYFTSDYRIILRSQNQNVTFSDIQSFIDPSVLMKNKKKRWSLGLQAGIGGMIGWDVLNKKKALTFGPYIGLGINYKILEW